MIIKLLSVRYCNGNSITASKPMDMEIDAAELEAVKARMAREYEIENKKPVGSIKAAPTIWWPVKYKEEKK